MMLLVASAFACPSFDDAVDRALAALLLGDTVGTDTALGEAQASLGCTPVSNAAVARYWLVEGARLYVAGDVPRAGLAFDAARRVAPEVWEASLGPAIREAYDNAVAPPGAGTVDLDANREHTHIDGEGPKEWPAPVDAGVHLVQVTRGDEVFYGKLVPVGEGEDVYVATALPPLPDVVPRSYLGSRNWWWIAGAGIVAAGGGALAYAATLEDDTLRTTEDVGELDAAWRRQSALTYGAYGLWSASALGVGAFFVF